MNFKKLLITTLIRRAALLGFCITGFSAAAQTNVTVDATAAWAGGMLVYDNTPEQAFLWYSDWGLDDVKTVKDAQANTLTLYPNYNVYAATDAYWANGDQGNKIMMGMSLIIDDALATQEFTFSGEVLSYTIAAGYEVQAFVKTLDANWGLVNEATTDITEPGNFTIAYNAAQYTGAVHVQYGFSVKGLNANPAFMEQLGNVVVTAGEPEVTEPVEESTEIAVDASAEWVGGMLVYDNTPEQAFLWYSDWGLDDVKTVKDTEANTITLYPNYNVYVATDAYWANGDQGNKIMQGMSYVIDDTLLGENISFNGNISSYTIAQGYTVAAFVKSLDANWGLIHETVVPITTTGNFEVNFDSDDYPGSVHLQYGFSVKGLNANPAFMNDLGNVVIETSSTAGTQNLIKKAVTLYPNPAGNVLNIAAEGIINNIQVYNLMGQQVLNLNPLSGNATVNVSGLSSGLYMVNVTANGKASSSKFVKE